MTRKPHKPKIGRPSILGADAIYVTVKLPQPMFKAINRIAGPARGRLPSTMRDLLEDALKLARRRVARC